MFKLDIKIHLKFCTTVSSSSRFL